MDAECVQLEQFARVVFVRAILRFAHAVFTAVKVGEHRLALGRGGEEFGELSKRVWPNDVPVVCRLEPFAFALGDVDVEVVAPKPNHHLVQLTLRVNGAGQRGAGEFFVEEAGPELVKLADRGKGECLEFLHAKLGAIVVGFFRRKLFVDELGHGILLALGQAENALVLPRPRAEREAIERVCGEADRFAAGRRERRLGLVRQTCVRPERLVRRIATGGSHQRGGAASLQESSPVELHHSSVLGRDGRRGRRGRWLGLFSESPLGIWLRCSRELRGESSSSLATGSGAEVCLGARPPRPRPRSLLRSFPRSLPRPESDVTNAPQPLMMLHGKMTNQPANGSR